MAPFPVKPARRPACLTGQQNGRLPDRLLVDLAGQHGGPLIRLVSPASRGFCAMRAAALAEGHVLEATSAADSYRLYAIQERIFRQRYTSQHLPGRPSRVWNGTTWWQRPGTAAAAVPGTSNHGWGLAVDLVVNGALLEWLRANADRFGWSWELQIEPWHVHWWAGDDIPAAVLEYEAGNGSPTDDEGVLLLWS